jgi:polyhydroxyalkanoate synthesis regulator phasin
VSENVKDVTIDILKSIQASIAELSQQTAGRFDRLEAGMRKDRRNVAGMLVMMRATAGEFDERVSDIEERVAALEGTAR